MEHGQAVKPDPLLLLAWLLSASPLTLHWDGGVFVYAVLGYGLWLLILIYKPFRVRFLLQGILVLGVTVALLLQISGLAIFWQFILFSLVAFERGDVSSRFSFFYKILSFVIPTVAVIFLVPYLILPLPAIWFVVISFCLPFLFFLVGVVEHIIDFFDRNRNNKSSLDQNSKS